MTRLSITLFVMGVVSAVSLVAFLDGHTLTPFECLATAGLALLWFMAACLQEIAKSLTSVPQELEDIRELIACAHPEAVERRKPVWERAFPNDTRMQADMRFELERMKQEKAK